MTKNNKGRPYIGGKQVMIKLSDEMRRQLGEECARRDETMSGYIRRLIFDALGREQQLRDDR